MTEITKKLILANIQRELSDASDNLNRATCAFRGQDLTAQHGASGKTRAEWLAIYQGRYDDVRKAIIELENEGE